MSRSTILITVFCLFQLAAVSIAWVMITPHKSWEMTQQFYGHIGPGAFLVGLGMAAIFMADRIRELNRREAWLAIVAGAAYILADTFIMHPPLGVFDGAGLAEQEHVAIMGLILMLGISGLVTLNKNARSVPTAAHFLIGIAVAGIVFGNHHQHTVSGTVGHQATMIFLGVAALFRILEKYTEYAVAMIVTGYVFFSSQMGLAHYVDMSNNSAGAWVAMWAMFGFAAATGFLLLGPKSTESVT